MAPPVWPPNSVDVELDVKGSEAAIRTAGGWIGKSAGGMLDGTMRLRAASRAGSGTGTAEMSAFVYGMSGRS